MAARWPWVGRRFPFDFPVGKFPDILERYRGTPARLDDRLRGVSREVLTRRDPAGGWTILENIGHLLDLEPLWAGRLDDYLAGAPTLRAADITNATTNRAGHNERDPADLLRRFRAAREGVVARLDRLAEADWARVSVHSRLNQPLRLVDAIAFTCDHDDYHLARVGELLRMFRGEKSATSAADLWDSMQRDEDRAFVDATYRVIASRKSQAGRTTSPHGSRGRKDSDGDVVGAVLSMLANGCDYPLDKGPGALADHIATEWVVAPRQVRIDSQEAAEAVTVGDRNERWGATVFRGMTPDQQELVLEATRILAGLVTAKRLKATIDDHAQY